MTLHLLRNFVQWHDRRPGHGNIKTVAAAENWIASLEEDGEFATWTARCPTRIEQLEAGGSVYFVKARHTVFRMPFLRIEITRRGVAILMRPRLIRVERLKVGLVRGWRYLDDADAPADLPPREDAGDVPPEMHDQLREAGLV